MHSVRFWLAVALGAFLALFAVQNMGVVEVNLVFWTFQTSRFFVIATSFLSGAVIGWIFKSLQRSKRRHADPKISKSETLV